MVSPREPWWVRVLTGNRPSALEMLSGDDNYEELVKRSFLRWMALLLTGTFFAIALAGDHIEGFQRGKAAVFIVVLFSLVGIAFSPWLRFPVSTLSALIVALSPLYVFLWFWAGPHLEIAIAIIPPGIAAAFVTFRRRVAILFTISSLAGYGGVLAFADGYERPLSHWVLLAGFSAASAYLFSHVSAETRRLADKERTARHALEAAHLSLADMNQILESRVDEQVDEIDRLGRLRRFLSPQVADSVMSAGDEDLLATHRRQIAVVFIDLRGFTQFSAVAEPEDVVEVLTEFYAAVGAVVKRLEATVGAFAGDGVMAYFNDPVPCDDPAGRALDMATSLRLPMGDLGQRWSQRGFRIGYGVGIAYGYATLGTIGFEERSDYTPIGSVVNLASRLCDEAANGEILLDGRAHEAVHTHVTAEPVELQLKGFNGTVTAYRVTMS